MKVKLLICLIVVSFLVLGIAVPAQAQVTNPGEFCGLVTFSATSGLPGSKVDVSSDSSGWVASDDTVTVMWDGTNIASIPTSVDGNTFSGSFNVPVDATPGVHTVTLSIPSEGTVECDYPFTVTEEQQQQTQPGTLITPSTPQPSVQQAAYPAAVSSLPSTGVFLLVPAAGLAFGGLGALTLRRRRG